MPQSTPLFAIATTVLLALCLNAAAVQGQAGGLDTEADTAWNALTATRNALAQSARAVPFQQTFVPAGFSSGDLETGVVSFDLPDCLRWDYHQPDPRSYLLCDRTVMVWNQGEDSGRRLHLDGEQSGAFELWLAPMAELRNKYRATKVSINGDYSAVRISPSETTGSANAGFAVAEITVDLRTGLPTRFEYEDEEGSETAFEFAAGELLPARDPRFLPPEIEWVEGDY